LIFNFLVQPEAISSSETSRCLSIAASFGKEELQLLDDFEQVS
jgi:hypothetical protein